jgi:hypothetical protein
MYDLSEQMGVSPWYFWDDVHTPRHPLVAFLPDAICAHGEPTVKYRGIFINDEIPVLWNWARETFNVSYPENPIQVGVYERVYETILRMKGNYLWPASKWEWVGLFWELGRMGRSLELRVASTVPPCHLPTSTPTVSTHPLPRGMTLGQARVTSDE